jgi:NAD dependent epimerase/dehydratase family enzyme
MNATAPDPVRNRDLARALGRVLRRPGRVSTPAFALRAALGEMAEVVLASQRVVPRRALSLGYRFRWPALEPALRDLLH